MARWFVDRSAQRGIPSVSLRRLLPEATFAGVSDLNASGCSADTRRLDPGQVFVALRGHRHDGHDFVGLALERGAAAVVVERPCPEAGRLQVIVPETRLAFARISHALAGDPSRMLATFGVSGTTGKMAASAFLRAILEASGQRIGLIGASGWSDGVSSYPARPTEPDAAELSERLGRMVDRRCMAAVLSLNNARLLRRDADGLTLAGALTTGVHAATLDAASAFAARKAQARLFRRVAPGGVAVVRADDSDAELLGAVNLEARRVSYALEGPADVSAVIEQLDTGGTRFRLRGFDREKAVWLRLIGRRNLASALAASALAFSQGIAADAVVHGLESVARLPGRLELLGPSATGVICHRDQARTGPALAEALAALREAGARRVLCVLVAGDDLANLHLLGRAAESGADAVLASLAETFRGDPDTTIDALLTGFRRPGRVRIESDPRHAFALAHALACPGDAILLAGSSLLPAPRNILHPADALRRSA